MAADRHVVDVVIIGGGAAGLWTLDLLVRQGHAAVLLEHDALGSGQTMASQGIIHGGLKYSLSGLLSSSARAIRDMPGIWRRCLAGEEEPDLSGTTMRAESCHLWNLESLRSRVGMAGARIGLRVAPEVLDARDRPAALTACRGTVARLDEQVIEPGSFLGVLAARHRQRVIRIDRETGAELERDGDRVAIVRWRDPATRRMIDVAPAWILLAAGVGNAELRRRFGLEAPRMQWRPLHMVMARGRLPVINGHCVDGQRTRVTITTTRDHTGTTVWQIGGQVSEDGVNMTRAELIEHTRSELASALPSFDACDTEWSTYRVDRAEGTGHGRRPDEPTIYVDGRVITAWPTKLAFAPKLADMVANAVGPPSGAARTVETIDATRPVVALPPWNTCEDWS